MWLLIPLPLLLPLLLAAQGGCGWRRDSLGGELLTAYSPEWQLLNLMDHFVWWRHGACNVIFIYWPRPRSKYLRTPSGQVHVPVVLPRRKKGLKRNLDEGCSFFPDGGSIFVTHFVGRHTQDIKLCNSIITEIDQLNFKWPNGRWKRGVDEGGG